MTSRRPLQDQRPSPNKAKKEPLTRSGPEVNREASNRIVGLPRSHPANRMPEGCAHLTNVQLMANKTSPIVSLQRARSPGMRDSISA